MKCLQNSANKNNYALNVNKIPFKQDFAIF